MAGDALDTIIAQLADLRARVAALETQELPYAVDTDTYNDSAAKIVGTDADGGVRLDHVDVGNTTGAGEGEVRAPLHTSVYRADSGSVADNTWANVYSFPNVNEVRGYLICADTGYTADTANYGGYAVVITDGASGRVLAKAVGTNFDIGLAGTPPVLQVKQISGGARHLYASILRWH